MPNTKRALVALVATPLLALGATTSPADAAMGGHWQTNAKTTNLYGPWKAYRTALNAKTKDGGPGCVITGITVRVRTYGGFLGEPHRRGSDGDTPNFYATRSIVGLRSIMVLSGARRSSAVRIIKPRSISISKNRNGVIAKKWDFPDVRVSRINIVAYGLKSRLRAWPDAVRAIHMNRPCPKAK